VAESSSTTDDALYNTQYVRSYASGGAGGAGLGPGSSGGDGGNATAKAQGEAAGAGSLDIYAYARGGRGGQSPEGSRGRSGQAEATATGSAGSGSVAATAKIYLDYYDYQSVQAHATAPIASTSTAVARASEGSPLSDLTETLGFQAAAFTTALPESAGLSPWLAANPKVQAAFNGDSTVLGYNVLGATASGSLANIYSASTSYFLDTSSVSTPQNLLVGFLDASFTGSDFIQLTFSVYDNILGKSLYEQTFTDAALALAFFDDRVLDLGSWDAILNDDKFLNLAFGFSLEALNDTAFACNFIYGNGTATVVPLPGGILIFGSGLALLLTWRKKFL